jgi:Ras-related protein Rab-18
MDVPPPDHSYKVCLCGESGVGKSYFIAQALHEFNNAPSPEQRGIYVTIGMDIRTLRVTHAHSGKNVALMLYDTAGQEKMRDAVGPMYWRNAHAIVFVYDLCSKDSYEACEWWIGKARDATSTRVPFVVVIGNKLDKAQLYRQVSQQEVSDECGRLNYSFMEISAMTGERVQEAISALVDALLRRDELDRKAEVSRKDSPPTASTTVSLVPVQTSNNTRRCCV